MICYITGPPRFKRKEQLKEEEVDFQPVFKALNFFRYYILLCKKLVVLRKGKVVKIQLRSGCEFPDLSYYNISDI